MFCSISKNELINTKCGNLYRFFGTKTAGGQHYAFNSIFMYQCSFGISPLLYATGVAETQNITKQSGTEVEKI
jgi:hypothetical protein